MPNSRHILQITCPDQKGLIAGTTQVLAKAGANILDLNQHTAIDVGMFFLRALFECDAQSIQEIRKHLEDLAPRLQIQWHLHDCNQIPRVALFGSRTDHCLYELLLKRRDGELACDFCCLVSNHLSLEPLARQFGIPFHYVASDKSKEAQEDRFRAILKEHSAEAIVLARYMQILSATFCDEWKERIINIHHGFLPAFQGAKPYHQAWAKGVKLIGATAHYATSDLDQGPILWQAVQRVPDTSSINELIQLGKDVEKQTLSTALRLWLERRVFTHNGRTFIF